MYAAMIEAIHLYDDEVEVHAALVWRDSVHHALRDGAIPTAGDARTLDRADALLAGHWRMLRDRFPEVFEDSASIPSEYWWWHLDEGPQVREEALAATRGARRSG